MQSSQAGSTRRWGPATRPAVPLEQRPYASRMVHSPGVPAMRSLIFSRSTSGVSWRKPSRYSAGMSPRSASTSSRMVLQAMILKVVMSCEALHSGQLAGRTVRPAGGERAHRRRGDGELRCTAPFAHDRPSPPECQSETVRFAGLGPAGAQTSPGFPGRRDGIRVRSEPRSGRGGVMDESRDARQEEQPAAEEAAGHAAAATGGRMLLVYASRHGSTREVADAVATELQSCFATVDVREAADAPAPSGYDAVVVGGPMIMGWHRAAASYVRQHREALARMPFALFVTAASLTEDGADEVDGVPVAKDPWLVKAPRDAGKLHRRERYALPAALPARRPEGVHAGAAAERGVLRRLARPHDDEHLRESVRAARDRRDAGRRPSLGLRARVGDGCGADAEDLIGRPARARPSGGAAGAPDLTASRGRREAGRVRPRRRRPASTRPPGSCPCDPRCSRRAAARRRSPR